MDVVRHLQNDYYKTKWQNNQPTSQLSADSYFNLGDVRVIHTNTIPPQTNAVYCWACSPNTKTASHSLPRIRIIRHYRNVDQVVYFHPYLLDGESIAQ